ncbi:hypothetical protein Sste5346_001031 [Sporothrix stenoceras]|uniref:Uncharacterized protein n=1 Tax=Sporothrix stenoceras TaxID=5173 RepID=A0ABR3ZQ31_9PEZI
MSTEVGVAARPSASLTDDELHLMMEYEKIVKLSESITSGKHPRIKIPTHLAPASSNLPARPDKRSGRNTNTKAASKAAASQGANGTTFEAETPAAHLGDNLVAFGQNSELSVGTAATASLPRLGATSGIRPVSPSVVSLEEIPLQRARVEALLREPSNRRGNVKMDEAQADFMIGDVFVRGRELEKTFTPPPVAILSQDAITNLGGASAKSKANVVSSAAADSGDEQTFYSSNFSTPEFALTSRVLAESDNDDMSMEDGSDYEPELDVIPPPGQTAQQTAQNTVPQPDSTALQQAPADQLAAALSQLSGQAPADFLTSLIAANIDPASLCMPVPPQASVNPTPAQIQQAAVAALSAWPGLAGASQTVGGGNGSSATSVHQRVAAGNPQPSSPFVRTHDLSPVAPQPAHISSLAVASHLPLSIDGQSGSQGTPAQVAMLRQGEASQSSPDNSPYIDGRAADKGKGKKRNVGKRKADVAPSSPYIKPEPRSPSPILAPPAQQRPPKRQKQDARPPPREVVYRRHEDEYSPTMQAAPYGTARVARDPRAPIIYERVDRGGRYVQSRAAAPTRRASVQRYEEQRNLEGGYEQSSPSYAPSYPARPPSRQYAAAPGQPNLRPVRAATHALVETSSGYPAHATADYDGSGRMSVRPLAMAPPPRERIVVDEFGREYYEPVPPAPRPQQQVVETVAYDPNLAYERPASRQHQIRHDARYGSQAPQPVYDDEEVVYRRTSPVFAAPRRVVTQPEYVAREYAGYPRREFSARPPSQYPAAAPERGYMVEEAPPPPGYLARASTARPPDAARYEAPPPGRYVERVGSVRPSGSAVYQGYAGGPEDGQQHMYSGPAGGAYIEDHRGPHEVIREYSVRPEPHVVVHGEYGARPGPAPPYYAEQPQYVMGGPPAPQEYGYPDERGQY